MTDDDRFKAARAVVKEQARDGRLWCQPSYITEATLQNELRRLHAAVEGVKPDDLARDFLAALDVTLKETRNGPNDNHD